MRYFDYLSGEKQKEIFFLPPETIGRDSNKDILSYGLGAALYMPADRDNMYKSIFSNKSVKTIILCLEDAIGDKRVKIAQDRVLSCFKDIYDKLEEGDISYEDLPFIFLRIRNSDQLMEITDAAGDSLKVLTGFVFPKVTVENTSIYFEELVKVNQKLKKTFYGMPILESKEIIYKEYRAESLQGIKNVLDEYQDLVLNVRVGATDFCSQFGIRRSYDTTIYDIVVVRDCIADILNVFGRIDNGYVLSGPVWEYFSNGDRVLKSQLRQSPFEESYGSKGVDIRKKLLSKYLDGLIREVLMDKANGFIGKTIIHPTHNIPVQALQVVSHEEYMDACSIIDNSDGNIGVIKSQYKNKMNEIKPHLNWAKKIMIKSKIYGVLHEKQNFTSLFTNL